MITGGNGGLLLAPPCDPRSPPPKKPAPDRLLGCSHRRTATYRLVNGAPARKLSALRFPLSPEGHSRTVRRSRSCHHRSCPLRPADPNIKCPRESPGTSSGSNLLGLRRPLR